MQKVGLLSKVKSVTWFDLVNTIERPSSSLHYWEPTSYHQADTDQPVSKQKPNSCASWMEHLGPRHKLHDQGRSSHATCSDTHEKKMNQKSFWPAVLCFSPRRIWPGKFRLQKNWSTLEKEQTCFSAFPWPILLGNFPPLKSCFLYLT